MFVKCSEQTENSVNPGEADCDQRHRTGVNGKKTQRATGKQIEES